MGKNRKRRGKQRSSDGDYQVPVLDPNKLGFTGEEVMQVMFVDDFEDHRQAFLSDNDIRTKVKSVLSEADDTDKLIQYLQRQKQIDDVGLYKRIPNTAKAMNHGELSEVVLSETLELALPRTGSSPVIDDCFKKGFGIHMSAVAAVYLSSILDMKNSSIAQELIDGLYSEFSTRVFGKYKFILADPAAPLPLPKQIQSMVISVCEEMTEKLDKIMFPGRCPGQTLLRIRLYQQPLESYKRLYKASFEQATKYQKRNLTSQLNTTIGLLSRFSISRSCWECGKLVEELRTETEDKSMRKCSTCCAATYCGRGCQIAAWKNGHKASCKHMQRVMGIVEESLEAMVDVHFCGRLEEYPPRMVLDRDAFDDVVFLAINNHYSVGVPSMKFFYKNLRRSQKGTWWLFPASEVDTVESYKKKIEAELDTVENYKKKIEVELQSYEKIFDAEVPRDVANDDNDYADEDNGNNKSNGDDNVDDEEVGEFDLSIVQRSLCYDLENEANKPTFLLNYVEACDIRMPRRVFLKKCMECSEMRFRNQERMKRLLRSEALAMVKKHYGN